MPDVLARGKSNLFGINGFYWNYSLEEVRNDKFLASGSYFVGGCGSGGADVVRGFSRKGVIG
jgi:hypothetical protein